METESKESGREGGREEERGKREGKRGGGGREREWHVMARDEDLALVGGWVATCPDITWKNQRDSKVALFTGISSASETMPGI